MIHITHYLGTVLYLNFPFLLLTPQRPNRDEMRVRRAPGSRVP